MAALAPLSPQAARRFLPDAGGNAVLPRAGTFRVVPLRRLVYANRRQSAGTSCDGTGRLYR